MGSSPLTRGKQHRVMLHQQVPGLIPAHAGKTLCRPHATWKRRAHPRSRGENNVATWMSGTLQGSSPLTRGKQRGHLQVGWHGVAHPRSRGENSYIPGGDTGVKGSSPLTRGKRTPLAVRAGGEGLIPAHAGKTRSMLDASRGRAAHPRSRGENVVEPVWTNVSAGSSPLTRGKHTPLAGQRPVSGLIPAHAGKTRPRRVIRDPRPAHPRSRGENIQSPSDEAPPAGSSPLTRGKLGFSCGRFKNHGLIPAHAGKTFAVRPQIR